MVSGHGTAKAGGSDSLPHRGWLYGGSRRALLPDLLLPPAALRTDAPVLTLDPGVPVGARLPHFRDFWGRLTSDQWVLSLLEGGYPLELGSFPQFNGLVHTRPPPGAAPIISEEVAALLAKNAVRLVEPQDWHTGYFSTHFLVPKKDGGLRPILNLKKFNVHMVKRSFRMETLATIISIVEPGQWSMSIDLKEAYFHIPIHPAHQRSGKTAVLTFK